jgi:hypothetical protein
MHRLKVEEQSDGRVAVSLKRSGQIDFEPAGDPVPFSSPLGEAEREDLRWYLEDYLIAPYAVYEERGRKVESACPSGAGLCSRASSAPASRVMMPISRRGRARRSW